MDLNSDGVPPRAWAEINAAAVRNNIGQLRDSFASARLMAVVKANAYGHGMSLIAPAAADAGVTDFGVATVAEGIELRRLVPHASIYVIALTLPEEAPAIVRHQLIPFISTVEMARAIANSASACSVVAEAHLEADTGIGRAGATGDDLPGILAEMDRLGALKITGLATHFASADEDLNDARSQWEQFRKLLRAIGPRSHSLTIHAANSPAALVIPPSRHHLVRPGLLLYGIEPAPGMFAAFKQPLQHVLSLKARVLLCRPLPSGASISYGRTYLVPDGGGVFATLGIGYGDGLPRRLSGPGYVLLHGRRAPIRGRVCMDQVVVDVTEIPGVSTGDTATIIGVDGDEEITVGQIAQQIGTTPHEITTCLTGRIPRALF